MKIGWIGGLDRSETRLMKTAAEAGHVLEFHGGHMKGRGGGQLRHLVSRSEVVVIMTSITCHHAMWEAKEAARKYHRPAIMLNNCSQSAFRKLLEILNGVSGITHFSA